MIIVTSVSLIVVVEEHFQFIGTSVEESVVADAAGMMICKHLADKGILVNVVKVASGRGAPADIEI